MQGACTVVTSTSTVLTSTSAKYYISELQTLHIYSAAYVLKLQTYFANVFM